ncbi:MAG: hypothetical protein MUF18_08375 [Fimbriiglobus sp.]|nr:hypothetical protein [Fimbriiglobus sp.]
MLRRLSAVFLGGLLALPALAQQPPQNVLPQPRVNSVLPLGAKAGTAVELTVLGTDLDDPTALTFSHPGITAELIPPPEPKPDPAKKDPPKPAPKAPVTKHKYKVTVPADAPLGTHDVRLVTKYGASNARAFVVGTLPEVMESDKPHADVPDAQKVELNSTINGTIASTSDVDYYSFAGKARQRVLVNCQTSSVDSRCRPLVEVFAADGKRLGGNRNYKENDALADVTLPADGDYLVRVCEFAYQSGSADHFYRLTISTGPWMDAVVPNVVNPGKPTPATVYGRNLPGGKKLQGTEFETLSVTITPPADAPRDGLSVRDVVAPPQALQDGFEFRLPGALNALPVFFTDAATHIEKDAGNDALENAEPIAVPCDVLGTIGKRYDKDWFRFEAKKGDVLYFELFADRLGSGMDTYFVVKNATGNKGNVVEEQDDDQDSLHPVTFFTRNGDPAAAKFTAPADGPYVVMVASREGNVNYGPRCVYRLRVSKPAPDFRAVVLPKSRDLNGASLGYASGQVGLDVFVERRDGFREPVTITAEGLPTGVTAKPAIIGTGQRWGTLVLNVADGAAAFTGPIAVKCSATIADKPVSHLARPASITWSVQPGNNTPTITRLDRQLILAVRPEKAHLRVSVDVPAVKVKTKDKDGKEAEKPAEFPLFVKPGDKITLPVKVQWQGGEARANPVNVRFEAAQPNGNQAAVGVQGGDGNNPNMTIPKEKNDGALTVDVRPTAAPGVYTIGLRADTQISFLRDPSQKDKKSNAVVQAFTEPFTVTVLPTALGKFTAAPPANNQLKAGTTAELVLKVERQADYAGEFAVKVVLTPEAKGVTVKDAVLPANASEVKIPLTVAADAKDATLTATLTATATVHGKFPITHEVKVQNLRVVPEMPKKK